jgi:hypothetical protein
MTISFFVLWVVAFIISFVFFAFVLAYGGFPWNEISASDYEYLTKYLSSYPALGRLLDTTGKPVSYWRYARIRGQYFKEIARRTKKAEREKVKNARAALHKKLRGDG